MQHTWKHKQKSKYFKLFGTSNEHWFPVGMGRPAKSVINQIESAAVMERKHLKSSK